MLQQIVPVDAPPAYEDEKKVLTDGEKFREVCLKYEITQEYAKKMHILGTCDIVIIVDDSGSMNTPTKSNDGFILSTRWSEAKTIVNQIAEISSIFDKDGIDIYFLNRPDLKSVKDLKVIERAFEVAPKEFTPLCKTLRRVIREQENILLEKNLLIFIATDGEPNDSEYKNPVGECYSILQTERKKYGKNRTYVNFLACTDDLNSVEFLNYIDKNIDDVDVSDDFITERAQIRKHRGDTYKFTYGNYIVKALVGSIDASLDKSDEGNPNNQCCIIC